MVLSPSGWPLAGGGTDTYVLPEKYHHQFAADLPEMQSTLMAVTQPPVTAEALAERDKFHRELLAFAR